MIDDFPINLVSLSRSVFTGEAGPLAGVTARTGQNLNSMNCVQLGLCVADGQTEGPNKGGGRLVVLLVEGHEGETQQATDSTEATQKRSANLFEWVKL